MVSIGKLPEKERRKVRRYNHIVRDLHKSKYRMQVLSNKKKEESIEDFGAE